MPANEAGSSGLTRLAILVRPNAPASGIVSYRDQVLRVDLAAPPVDGRANSALIRVLAEALGVGQSRVRLLRGEAGRRKLVELDLPAAQVARWLDDVNRLRTSK